MVDQSSAPVLAQRVGDAERDVCIDLLTEHHVSGRLSAEDLDLRHRAALCAVTRGDLAALLRDLPLVAESSGRSDLTSHPPAVPGPRRRWRGVAWLVPPGALVGAAALMSNYRTDLLDREDAFVAALATGAVGFVSHWFVSVAARRTR